MDVDKMMTALKQAILPDAVVSELEQTLAVKFTQPIRTALRDAVFDYYLFQMTRGATPWGKKRLQRREQLLQRIATAYDDISTLLEEECQEGAGCPKAVSLQYRYMASSGDFKWSVLEEAARCRRLASVARTAPQMPETRSNTERKNALNRLIRAFAKAAFLAGHIHTEGSTADGQRKTTPFVTATRMLLSRVAGHPPSHSAIAERVHEYGLLRGMLAGRKGAKLAVKKAPSLQN